MMYEAVNPKVEKLINDIIKTEGGYVNDPADNGGPTNMGITQKTLSRFLGRPATINDVKYLTKDLAFEIYLRNYYIKPRFDTLPEDLQYIMTDTGVLHGPKAAVEFLQLIINESEVWRTFSNSPLVEDGIFGPATRRATTLAYQKMGKFLINALVEERIKFYNWLVSVDSSKKKFLKGWINRAEKFRVQ